MVFGKTRKKLDKIAVSLINKGLEPVQFFIWKLDKLDSNAITHCFIYVFTFHRKRTFLDMCPVSCDSLV
jgi:hypothetical protein